MPNIELLPLVPLEDAFVFPNTVQKIPVHAISSSILVDEFFSEHHYAIVSLSKLPLDVDLSISDFNQNFIHTTGIKVELIQQTSLANGEVRVVVEGLSRVTIHQVLVEGERVVCQFSEFENKDEDPDIIAGLAQGIYDYFKEHLDVLGESAPDTLLAVLDISQPEEMADIMGSYLPISADDKQTILEAPFVSERLKKVRHFLNDQIIDANVNKNIDSIVQTKVDGERRDSLLRAKLRAIQNELRDTEDNYIQSYSDRLKSFNLVSDSYVEIRKEIQKLERAGDESSESNLIRSYLDFVLALPWNTTYTDEIDLVKVQSMLDQYHYGLEHVKERILEYLAVRKLAEKPSSNILCLAGPPGVGKTSIVKSVAKAMGRPFCRLALGGIRDEADLRGHRRTYVGALPGRIVSALYKTQSFSPVILLDEIDKMSSGFKGDPSSVLLEILDPEQNDAFVDHYMQVPVDLSNVLFICTANDLEQIPGPLLNRLETIEITGYGLDEKLELATQYLVPDQLEKHGLTDKDVHLSQSIITHIIADYTDDVGLRNLNRCFESIFRKVALKKVRNQAFPSNLKRSDINTFLGSATPKPSFSKASVVGRSVALYSVGMVGQILPVEVVVFKGTGRVISTGNIDPLLRETLLTALSYTKYNLQKFGLDDDYFSNHDFHIHFRKPELLKQGEGWGLAIFAGILSAVRNIPLSPSLAFAGQISLLGKLLPTRDIEQKVLAAAQLGITDVVASSWNFEDKAVYIPEELTVHKLEKMDQLLDLLLQFNKD